MCHGDCVGIRTHFVLYFRWPFLGLFSNHSLRQPPSQSFCSAHWSPKSPLAPGWHVRGPASNSESSGKCRNSDKMKVCGAQTPPFLGPATHGRGGKMGCWSRGGRGVLEKRPPGPRSAAPPNLSEFRQPIRQKRAKNLSESGQFVPPKMGDWRREPDAVKLRNVLSLPPRQKAPG